MQNGEFDTHARVIKDALYASDPDAVIGGRDHELLAEVNHLARRAFAEGDAQAELQVHQTLYRINLACLAVPWQHPGLHPRHPFIAAVRHALEVAWDRHDRARHANTLTHLPDIGTFRDWVCSIVQSHSSNVSHPLFPFLRDQATYQQLRRFVMQETPLEVFFGDVLTLMLPGVYGPMKVELCKNFWDEMGHAEETRMHRVLRLDLMAALDIPADHYLTHITEYYIEELRLINMYFDTVHNRGKLLQSIGIMLATEFMIPGRLACQIAGWRRVGMSEDPLAYLIEHTTVDVEHADGWMNQVVMPLLHDHPAAMSDMVLGVLRRLDNAGAVCDRFYKEFAA